MANRHNSLPVTDDAGKIVAKVIYATIEELVEIMANVRAIDYIDLKVLETPSPPNGRMRFLLLTKR